MVNWNWVASHLAAVVLGIVLAFKVIPLTSSGVVYTSCILHRG